MLRHKHNLRLLLRQIARFGLPAVIAVLALLYGVYGVLFPAIEEQMFKERRETVRKLTDTAWSTLQSAEKDIQAGLMTREDVQKRTIQRFHDLRYGDEGKGYFWVLCPGPVVVMHPYMPQIVGKNMSEFRDAEGRLPVVEMIEVAKNNPRGGFVEYLWQREDNPNLIEAKISFVRRFEPWQWTLGTGVYVDDIREDLARAKGKLNFFSAIVLVVTALAISVLAFQAFRADTIRAQREQELQSSEAYSSRLVANAPDGILVMEGETIVDCNQQMQVIAGYSPDELIGTVPWQYSPPVQASGHETAKIGRQVLEETANGGARRFEWDIIAKNGEPRHVEINLVGMEHDDRRRFLLFMRDFTDRYQAELQLQAEREFSETLLNNAPVYIILGPGDGKGTVYNANTAFLENFGYSQADLQDLDILSLVSDTERDRIRQAVKRVREKGVTGFASQETILTAARTKDNRVLQVSWSLVAVRLKGRDETGILSIGTDLTQQRNLENQVHEAQKMDALGQLARGVAHDFNNALSSALGEVDVMELERIVPSSGIQHLQSIKTSLNKATQLVKRLLTFSRKSQLSGSGIDMHDLIHETAQLLRSGLTSKVKLNLVLGAEKTVVQGDEGLLQNALSNLGLNAKDAMPDGGILTISTSNRTLAKDSSVGDDVILAAGDYICISVIDTGCGMTPSTQERIFEPFYTTKPQGEGIGLGLSSAYSAVREHRGAITVRSKLNTGSEFEILLPCSEVEVIPASGQREPVPFQPCSIMFIDDELSYMEAVCDYLETQGCAVHPFADGASAVEFFREHPEEVDLAIIDVVMPDMDGKEVFRALRRIAPQIRAVMMSGTNLDEVIPELRAEQVDGYLSKPFSVSKLMSLIGSVMASPLPTESDEEDLPGSVEAVEESQAMSRDSSWQRRALLLLEDERSAGLLEDVLHDRGYEVQRCYSCSEVDECLSVFCPSLFLLDSETPGFTMDKFQAVRQARIGEDCYTMIFASRAGDFDAAAAFSAGINDYLLKPFAMDIFAVRLDVAEGYIVNVRKRIQAEASLRELNRNLEACVLERTAKLEERTKELQSEIAYREEVEKQLEVQRDQLAHADKMSALGVLVSCMAHEVNNPNNFISMNSSLLREVWDEVSPALVEYGTVKEVENVGKYPIAFLEERMPKMIDGISEGSERIARIISELKQYSRKGEVRYDDRVDLRECVSKAQELVGAKIRRHTDHFSVHGLEVRLPSVRGNAQALEQVIINLLINACDALPKRSCRLAVTLEEAADAVLVRVADEGVGMSDEVLSRVREPFYTTKEEGKGTGLGLSISEDIVKRHGGTMAIESESGQGTTITLSFPRIEGS